MITDRLQRICKGLSRADKFNLVFLDAKDCPLMLREERRLSVIARFIAVPVCAVYLNGKSIFRHHKVHTVASDFSPLLKGKVEPIKFDSYQQFNRRLASVAVITRVRAEASFCGLAGRLTKFFFTDKTRNSHHWASAQLRTKPPLALLIPKMPPASSAVCVGGVSVFAFERTDRESVSDAARPTERGLAYLAKLLYEIRTSDFVVALMGTKPPISSEIGPTDRLVLALAFFASKHLLMLDRCGVVAVSRAVLTSVLFNLFVAETARHAWSIIANGLAISNCRCTEGLS